MTTRSALSAAYDVGSRSTYMSLPNKGQLAVLCIARLADPLAATSIQVPKYSYYRQLMQLIFCLQSYMFYQLKFFDPTASDATISTQAGFIISAKTAAQVCTGVFWGRLADSDRIGRRTVLLVGLLSSGMLL